MGNYRSELYYGDAQCLCRYLSGFRETRESFSTITAFASYYSLAGQGFIAKFRCGQQNEQGERYKTLESRRTQMNRRRFLVTGSLGVLSAGCNVQRSSVQSAVPAGLTALQERKAMPSFDLPGLDGRIVRSGDLIGNVAILRFWATW